MIQLYYNNIGIIVQKLEPVFVIFW